MSDHEKNRELYYSLRDTVEVEEKMAWRGALEPALSLERELLKGMGENAKYLYSNIIAAIDEVATVKGAMLEDHAYDCGLLVGADDPLEVANEIRSYLSAVKVEAAHLSAFLAENRLVPADDGGLGGLAA